MPGRKFNAMHKRGGRWLVLALVPMLSECLGVVALPLVAGGGLSFATRHRVRAATAAPAQLKTARGRETVAADALPTQVTLTPLTALPPPSGSPAAAVVEPWQHFFDYVQSRSLAKAPSPTKESELEKTESTLLVQPPSLEAPARRDCPMPTPAVVIDLDDDPAPFDPAHVMPAPPALAQGLAHLREAGVVVLWISRLPAARVSEVAQALKRSGLDPQGQDQLLLIRNGDDRKQLLRSDANNDVCIVAIAGQQRGDFDELFDYLRDPDAAIGLNSMMDNGWFLVPSLDASESEAAPAVTRTQAPAAPSTDR